MQVKAGRPAAQPHTRRTSSAVVTITSAARYRKNNARRMALDHWLGANKKRYRGCTLPSPALPCQGARPAPLTSAAPPSLGITAACRSPAQPSGEQSAINAPNSACPPMAHGPRPTAHGRRRQHRPLAAQSKQRKNKNKKTNKSGSTALHAGKNN